MNMETLRADLQKPGLTPLERCMLIVEAAPDYEHLTEAIRVAQVANANTELEKRRLAEAKLNWFVPVAPEGATIILMQNDSPLATYSESNQQLAERHLKQLMDKEIQDRDNHYHRWIYFHLRKVHHNPPELPSL